MNKILIIDHGGEQQTISIAHFLTDSGYEVVEAENVLRAIAILKRAKFDLILCSQKLFGADLALQKSIIFGDARHSKIILLREVGEKKSGKTQHARIIGNIEKPVDWKILLEVISAKAHKNGFTALVNDIDITDYLQLLAMNKMTKFFVVESENRSGVMALDEGELIYVAYGELRGELAFHALLSLQYGKIMDKNVVQIPPKNIHNSLARLLLEHAVNTDESTIPSGGDCFFKETHSFGMRKHQ